MEKLNEIKKKLYIMDMRIYTRKYQKVSGWWVYAHLTPDYQFIYLGYSGGKDGGKQCCDRWQPNYYKGTSLEPYIEKYGWDNLIHIVIQDGLTEEQAEKIEGALIKQAKVDGWCINQQYSGGVCKNKDYLKQYYEANKEYYKQYRKQYYEENKEELYQKHKQYKEERKERYKQYGKQWREEHKEYNKQYKKQFNSSPEGKIYNRVTNFNRLHPNKIIETPKEAKQKYLETGYIPNYIKNNDL